MGPSYNDSFGSFSSGGGGLSSGDSGGIFSGKSDKRSNVEQNSFDNQDIVLTPTPVNERKSSKKWAIVLLAVLAVAAIGLGIWWLIVGQKTNSPESKNADLEKSFSNYACYFMNGEVCDNFDGLEVPSFEDSYFIKSLNDGSFYEGYSSKLKEYFDNFNDIYNEESDADVNGLFYSNKVALNLVVYYYNGNSLSTNGILEKYLSDGEEAAKTMIASMVAPFESLGVLYGVNFYEMYYKWGMGTLELIKDYEKVGCIGDGLINFECVSQRMDSAMNDRKKTISKQYMDMDAVLGYSIKALYNNIFNIEEAVEYLITGEDEDEEE